MTQTMIDLTGTESGSLRIGGIVQSSPRRYSVTCAKCGSSWSENHQSLLQRLDNHDVLECRNQGCRSGVRDAQQKEREYFQTLKLRERQEEEALFDRRMRDKYGSGVAA